VASEQFIDSWDEIAASTKTVLDAYTALRPRRSTAAELEALAERLEREFAAPRTAAFVREALAVYAQRGFLAVDERSPAQV
jgi:propanediol dehydratase small subunit